MAHSNRTSRAVVSDVRIMRIANGCGPPGHFGDCARLTGYSEEIMLLSEEDILGLDLSWRHVISN